MSLLNKELTQPDPKIASQLDGTVPGMAHFAGTGPAGMQCKDCFFLQDLSKHGGHCLKYRDLMGRLGNYIKPHLRACKYFERLTGKPK